MTDINEISSLQYWIAKLNEAKELVQLAERNVIKAALNETGGEPTNAARLLGMKHQSFLYKLNHHHSDLNRSPFKNRRISQLDYNVIITKIETGRSAGLANKINEIMTTLKAEHCVLDIGDNMFVRFASLPLLVFRHLSHRPALAIKSKLKSSGAKAKLKAVPKKRKKTNDTKRHQTT